MKRVVCENLQGQQIEFTYDGYPLRLSGTDGFSDAEYTVNTTQSTGQDGETYLSSTANKRNIVITADIFSDYQSWGDRLRSFFQPRRWGTVYAYDGGDGRKIAYQVEKIDIEETDTVRDATISLICPDPVWKALEDETVSMARVEGDIEFPAELAEEFTVSRRNESVMATIDNDSNTARGLTIIFEASGTVTNPILIEATRQERLQVSVTMHSGDILTVTTGLNNKRVLLTSGGATTNVNNKWVYGSTWLQAEPGRNIYRYTAGAGEDSLSATIRSTPAYWGA